MLLIYTTQLSNRLQYVFDFVFKEQLGIEYRITNDSSEFLKSDSPKLNYSTSHLQDEIWIYAHPLLFEQGIQPQDIDLSKTDTPQLFPNAAGSSMPFDPFAAIFYLLSRYEEYGNPERDQYGRYDESQSILVKNEIQHIPLVDHYLDSISKLLNGKFPSLKFRERKFAFTPTFDIDIAFNYRSKGFLRNSGGYLMSLLKMDMASLIERTRVLTGNKIDPFDCFDWLEELHQQYSLNPIFFFLLGDYGQNDKNISHQNTSLRNTIGKIAEKHQVGIHPSYYSNENELQLKEEISRLEDIIGKKVKNSRQHFLKMTLPETYQQLIQNNITDDYTMGYSSQPGFRAGTTQSFLFYDLTKEETTPLRIHPFAIMDATLFYYLKHNPDQAIQDCKQIISEVKKVNGTLTTLWHNNFVSEWGEWRGWSRVYTSLLEEATK